jgi:hypothetical protein
MRVKSFAHSSTRQGKAKFYYDFDGAGRQGRKQGVVEVEFDT